MGKPQSSEDGELPTVVPDAEAARLLGLGPRLKELLQDLNLAEAPAPGNVPTDFGRYRVLRLIGEGGMGSVFEAEQINPRRRVALKVIKAGMDTKQVIGRFEAEREALARMDHPCIARVYDAGATDAGRPFFAMELVDGVPITDYCDQHSLTVRRRLELFIQVCRAVQHAHQKGVIHRDLKPSNVLVTLVDGEPVPKVIDFGIAKATDGQRLSEQTLVTESRQLLGTPEYMSPEQAGAAGGDVDTRSDVYSLGVLLYELLTGTTPFAHKQLRSLAYEEVRRIIREDEPPRPSTRLGEPKGAPSRIESTAGARASDAATLRKTVRGELDWIVMRCLEKDRTRRYETANELAADLERQLRNEAVHAGPPSTSYRLKKFARRNRVPLATAGAMAVLLVAGITGTTVGMFRARKAERVASGQKDEVLQLFDQVRDARTKAEHEAQKAGALNDFFQAMLADLEQGGEGPDVRVAELLDRAEAGLSERLKHQPEAEMRARLTLHQAYWNLGLEPQQLKNLRRAYDLMQQTRSHTTETGLRIRIAAVDHFDLPPRVTEARTAAADARELFGPGNVTIQATIILGRVLHLSGNSDEAEAVLQAAAQEWGWAASFQLGRVLQDRGKLDEAERAFRNALPDPKARYAGSRSGLRTATHLARVLIAREKSGEAADVLRAALAVSRPRLGNAHPDVINAIGQYVTLLRKLDRHEEATRLNGEYQAAFASRTEQPAMTPAALEDRGAARARRGQFKEAADDYGHIIKLDPSPYSPWFFRGCLLAYLADGEAYESHCRDMLQRFGKTSDRSIADRTAKVYLLVPRSPEECERVAALVDLPAEFGLGWFRMLKGLAAYRAGKFDSAIEWLNMAREGPRPASTPAIATIDLLLAMSHHQLGRADAARAAFDRARQLIDGKVASPGSGDISDGGIPNWLVCHVILREARSVLPPHVTGAHATEAPGE